MSTLTLTDSFPGTALVAALAVVKDKAVSTPAGQTQLLETGLALAYWGGLAMIGGGGLKSFSPGELSDDEAHALLEQSTATEEGLTQFGCPISPATALKLAAWLLKAAGFILPILL